MHPCTIEFLESRRLLTVASYASLVKSDLAAADFPSTNGKGTTVALIDTGIDYNLPALGGGFGKGYKVVGGYDFVDNDSNPIDTDGHGTDTAFVVAGNPITVNGITYQGVAPAANLVALRTGTEADGFSDSNIDKALQWVITNYKKFNISVVNLSLGSGSFTSAETESESADFATLKADGIFVVAASGNSNEDTNSPITQEGIAYPAADPSVFAVGAIDSTDTITDFSQRGTELDLLAPGVDIVMPSLTGGTVTEDGTSFSSPYVAGTAALLEQSDPGIAAGDVGSILMSSGKVNRDGDTETGNVSNLLFSRLNIDAALKLESRRIGTAPTIAMGTTFDTALDADGVLHAAYYDAKNHRLMYATRDNSGEWSKPTVIDGGANSAGDIGSQLSIAVDATGHVGIAYYDATNTALKYASFSGTGWSITTIDASKSVGTSPSLGFSIYGDAYIGYYRKTGGYLRLATLDRDTGTWTVKNVDGGSGANVGSDVSLSVAEAAVSGGFFTTYDTTVALAYADTTNGDLKYARLDVVDPTATWYIAIVDDLNGVTGIDLQLHDGPLDSGAQAQISFRDAKTGNIDYAYRNNDWIVSTVTTAKTTGNTALTFTDDEQPIVSYYATAKKSIYSATLISDGSFSAVKRAAGGTAFNVTFNDRAGETELTTLDRAGTAAETIKLT